MLVLTRGLNQSIYIGDPNSSHPPIEIKVMEVRANISATLGISAPRGIKVHRREIWDQVQEENKAAADTPTSTVLMR